MSTRPCKDIGVTITRLREQLSPLPLVPLQHPPHRSNFLICVLAAAAAKSLQSCPTLCNRIDGSPPGSSVPGILQAGIWSGLPLRDT